MIKCPSCDNHDHTRFTAVLRETGCRYNDYSVDEEGDVGEYTVGGEWDGMDDDEFESFLCDKCGDSFHEFEEWEDEGPSAQIDDEALSTQLPETLVWDEKLKDWVVAV